MKKLRMKSQADATSKRPSPDKWPSRTRVFEIIGLSAAIATGVVQAQQASSVAQAPSLAVSSLGPIYEQIEKSEYEIHWQPQFAAHMAPNRAHNLRFTFQGAGLKVEPRELQNTDLPQSEIEALLVPLFRSPQTESGVPWSVHLNLDSFGASAQNPSVVSVLSATTEENTATMQSSRVAIKYTNDKDGLRQDFLIYSPPSNSGQLRLDFSVTRNLIDVSVDQETVFFTVSGSTIPRMQYGDLKVFDALHRQLPANFEAVDEDHFSIVIQDTGAQYPILVDPTLRGYVNGGSLQDPGSSTHFGYSVAYIAAYTAGAQPSGPLAPVATYGGIIIGAPWFDPGSAAQAGKVFLYTTRATLGAGLINSPDWYYTGTQTSEHVGWSVADGGPSMLNGKYHNILVGAPGYANGYNNQGAAFAFIAQIDGSLHLTPDWTVAGGQAGANLGWSVSGNVDFDHDGYTDVIIGVPNYSSYSPSHTQNGQVRVYRGNASGLNTTWSWGPYGSADNVHFGYSVAHGDVNGDGYQDVIVGAPQQSTGGAVLVFHNASGTLHTSPDTTISGYPYPDEFGYVVASGFNQDGDVGACDDVLVGDPMATYNSQTQAGKAYLFRGSASGVSTSEAWHDGGTQAYEYFGTSLCGGDMNNDGYADIMIGSPSYSETGLGYTHNGKAVLYITNPSTKAPTFSCYNVGLCSSLNLGTSVAYGYPLINGNTNLIVGAPGADGVQCLNVQCWYFQP